MLSPIKVAYEELDFDHSTDGVLCRWRGQPFTGVGVKRYPDGSLHAESVFQDGIESDVGTLWDTNGQLQARTVADTAHILRTAEWFPNGNIKCRATREHGIRTAEQVWDSEGRQLTNFVISEDDTFYTTLLRHRAANFPTEPATHALPQNNKSRSIAPMENLGLRNILRIPLSNLWEVPDIRERIGRADAVFGPRLLRWFCHYELKSRIKMRAQLKWALQNPTHDFQNVLIDVKTNDEHILFYFARLLNLIEQDGCPDDTTAPSVEGT